MPRWGRVRLSDLRHVDVQAWVTTLSATRSPATVRKVHRVLSPVLATAVKDGRLARNAAAGVNLPRVVRVERQYLTHAEVELLADACAEPLAEPVSKHRRKERAAAGRLPAGRPLPGLHRCPVRRAGGPASRPVESSTPPSAHRRVGHARGLTPGVRHAEEPRAPRGADPAVPRRPAGRARARSEAGRAGVPRHEVGRSAAGAGLPSVRHLPRQPPPSDGPGCSRMSSATPQPRWPSPPAPTSRSCSRCWATPPRP